MTARLVHQVIKPPVCLAAARVRSARPRDYKDREARPIEYKTLDFFQSFFTT